LLHAAPGYSATKGVGEGRRQAELGQPWISWRGSASSRWAMSAAGSPSWSLERSGSTPGSADRRLSREVGNGRPQLRSVGPGGPAVLPGTNRLAAGAGNPGTGKPRHGAEPAVPVRTSRRATRPSRRHPRHRGNHANPARSCSSSKASGDEPDPCVLRLRAKRASPRSSAAGTC
jgi:hypothetical protein